MSRFTPTAPDARFGEDTKRILDAAAEAIAERGLRQTPMEDIARRAGISRATLFRRFPNRDELFRRLAEYRSQQLLQAMARRTAHLPTVEDRLAVGFVVFMRGLRGDGVLRALLRTDPARVLPMLTTEAGPILQAGAAYAEDVLRRAEQDGARLTADPARLGEIFTRIGLSLVLTPETTLPMDDDAELQRFARDALVPFAVRAATD